MSSKARATVIVLWVLLASAAAEPAESARRISLDVKDGNIHNVLRLLADTGQVNIVVPDDVQGRVTVHLKNVAWDDALGIILRSKGLGMERVGNIIQVDTDERILHRAREKAEIARAREKSAKLVTVFIPVRYTRAADLLPIVQSMLSERGRVEVDARTNTLIVTDVSEHVDAARASIGR
jgi:type IV pilus assembly protein PilQ